MYYVLLEWFDYIDTLHALADAACGLVDVFALALNVER